MFYKTSMPVDEHETPHPAWMHSSVENMHPTLIHYKDFMLFYELFLYFTFRIPDYHNTGPFAFPLICTSLI